MGDLIVVWMAGGFLVVFPVWFVGETIRQHRKHKQ